MSSGMVVAVNTSVLKGARKCPVSNAVLIPNFGIEGDAHAGSGHRQVSLLAMESIDKMIARGLLVGPGDFAENITTKGIALLSLPIGAKIYIGEEVELQVTQIGKICHTRCAIYHQAGDCVMPKEGVFAKVVKGGKIKKGDCISL